VQIYANIFISRPARAFITRARFNMAQSFENKYFAEPLNAAQSECVFKSKSCLLWEMSFLHQPPTPAHFINGIPPTSCIFMEWMLRLHPNAEKKRDSAKLKKIRKRRL
jgi:hypothetical protein